MTMSQMSLICWLDYKDLTLILMLSIRYSMN
nr:MAG TPA: hypothetical protein [Bacteriophage sp.]